MACDRLAKNTTNQKSQLFDYIYNNITNGNEKLADEYYAYFDSNIFKDEFGDWENDFSKPFEERGINQRLVDDNGEPRLGYDSIKAYHYYINKYGVKVPFPNNRGKLNDSYTYSNIRSVAKMLALDYFSDRIGENFNDIDLTARKKTLSTSIKRKLENKSNELLNSEDFEQNIKGEVLKESTKYLDEWVRHVENYFRESNLIYKEQSELEDLLEDETATREEMSFNKASFERSTKDNISANVKLALSLLVDPNEEIVDDLFYEPIFIPFDEVYSSLQSVLTGLIALEGEDLFELYLDEIYKLGNKKPYFLDLHRQLKNVDDYKKAEFIQAFNLDRNTFIGTILKIEPIVKYKTDKSTGIKTEEVTGFKTNIEVQDLSNVGARERFIKDSWYYNFVKSFADEKSRFNNNSIQSIEAVREIFNKVFSDFNTLSKDPDTTIEQLSNGILQVFEHLNVVVTEDGFNHFLDDLKTIPASKEEKIITLFKLHESTKYLLDNMTLNNLEKGVNIFDNQTVFKKLAQAEAFYISEGTDASFFSAGKTKWLYSYPSYLSTKLKEWKKDRNTLLNHYESTERNKGSFWMKWLLGLDIQDTTRQLEVSKERINNFNLTIFNSLQLEGDAINAVDNVNMSKNDAFADIVNKSLGFKGKNKKNYLNTPDPADKSMQYIFELHKDLMVDVEARVINNKIEVNEKTKKIIYNYIKAEFNRIKTVQQEIELAGDDTSKLISHYHLGNKNGLKFQLFPSLNPENFNSEEMGFNLYKDGSLIDYELLNLDELSDLEDIPNEAVIERKLIEFIENELHTNINEFRKSLYDAGILDRYNNKPINRAISDDIWESYDVPKNKDVRLAADAFINNLIAQVEYSNMFSGDVAYYKNMNDYTKRIPATYTDGLQLYITKGNEMFNAAVMQGVHIPTPYIKELEKTIGKDLAKSYKNINSTDAQAWITPKRWKFLLQGLGKWTSKHDVVFDKLTGENKDPFSPNELKLAAQPLKGVYFEINDGRPVYLKYSQAVLIPDLLVNSPGLAKLAQKMEDANIDELITIDGVKVGAFDPQLTHNKDGSVKDDFDLVPMPLKNSGWKLQQDLPIKTFKSTDIGSQIQKNIFSGIVNNLQSQYDVDGTSMSGKDLIKHINRIIAQLSDKGFESLMSEFGITPDYKITNYDKLNDTLIEELKSRGAAQNVIDALEAGITTYAVPGFQQKMQNIFASMITKRVVKIQTNGGSFIQMSNYGYSNEEANKRGVIYTPWSEKITSEPKFLTDENGDFILSENGKKILKPGGILISGSFIAKYVPNWRDYADDPDYLFGTKEKNYTDGLIDPEILKNIIGYRIPNQGLASNDALEIVGILPEGMGDTVVAYTGITTKTGSDFDIDKMYIMMPSFKARYGQSMYQKAYNYIKSENITREDIISELEDEGYTKAFLESTSDIKSLFVEDILFQDSENPYRLHFNDNVKDIIVDKLEYIRDDSKEGLGNQLIAAYKSVLTHPDIIDKVMTPIDFDYIKDDILSLFPDTDRKNLESFNIKYQLDLKYEFLAGKAGVGITANQLVDHVRGMMSKLYIPYLNMGEKVNIGTEGSPKYVTKLDSEFSEELTDAELKAYDKEINRGRKKEDLIDVYKLKSIRIADALSAIMNANVDIANDSYITRGNWTTQTSNIGMMLIRAGIHPFKVNAILGQPIIKEYSEFLVNQESKIISNTGQMEDKFIEENINKELDKLEPITIDNKTIGYRDLYRELRYKDVEPTLKKLLPGISNETINEIDKTINEIKVKFNPSDIGYNLNNISLHKLRENIRSESPNIADQFEIFKQFREWNKISKDYVVKNINASKADVDGYGKDITSLIINFNLIEQLKNNNTEFKGFASKLRYDGELTLLGSYILNSIYNVKKIMEANPTHFLTAHPTVINTFNEISKGIKDEVLLDQKLGDKINKHFYTYFMSGFKPLTFEPKTETSNDERIDLLTNLPDELNQFKKNNPNYTNTLLKDLDVRMIDGKNYITMSNILKSPTYQSDITSAWSDLIYDYPELGNKLIKYAFALSGLQMNINQFHTYIPYQFFSQNNINDYIKEVALELNKKDIDFNFLDQFFRHNMNDSSIVKTIFDSDINRKYNNTNAGFVLKESGRGNLYVKKEYINFNDRGESITYHELFKLAGYTAQNKAIYIRIGELGIENNKGVKIYEYNYDNEVKRSSFATNKITGIAFRNKITSEVVDNRDYFKKLVVKDIGEQLSNNNVNSENNEMTTPIDLFNDANDPFRGEC